MNSEKKTERINKIYPFYEEKHSNLFFSIDGNNNLVLWDLRSKKQLLLWNLSKEKIVSFEFTEGFREFYTAFENGKIQVDL